ncbi:RecB family exonuclease, partial [Candidatus Riflebacteria bacterium]
MYGIHTIFFFFRLWSKHQEGFQDKEQSDEWFATAEKHLQKYYDKYMAEQQIQPAYMVEPYFELPLESKKGRKVILEGYIDRIDKLAEGYEILDYKTEPKIRSQEEVDSDLQLAIYFAAGKKFLKLD